jgi:CRISPR-associated endonuclease/helicase Cas3
MMPSFRNLLAKKSLDDNLPQFEETLVGHTQRVCEMADEITSILAPKTYQAVGIDEHDLSLWRIAVRISACLHDSGKANDHFQLMLRKPGFKQGMRHEIISLYLICELSEWLEPLWKSTPPWFKSAIVFSISGHHLKFPDPYEDSRSGADLVVLAGHENFNELLQFIGDRFGLKDPPELHDQTLSLLRNGPIKRAVKKLRMELDYDFSEKDKILIALAKSTVMVADLAGSAIYQKISDPVAWIQDKVNRVLTTSQLKEVVNQKLKGQAPREFQRLVSESKSRVTIVEAGCGAGKTAAAYLWAANNANQKRLFFCYPTTGTASEGFAGYLRDPDFDAILIHSRSSIDYRLLENMPSPSTEEIQLRQIQLEALDTWPVPAVVCTAHTVLGLLENVRRGIYAFPSLIQSAYVFDEIHSFSDRLFNYLLKFIETFDRVPVLLMTATLPQERKAAIESVCLQKGGLKIIRGPVKRESSKRYLMQLGSPEMAWKAVKQCLKAGGKTLWVVNTVVSAMSIVDQAIGESLPVQPYHARYRYKDRLVHHRSVIDGFKPEMPSLLAVTTQVAEMSLDLSADLLVSEIAPVSSMIQRLGRLNRFEEKPIHIKSAIFIKPKNHLPYSEAELKNAQTWLSVVADNNPKSQSDLAESFVALSSDLVEKDYHDDYCEWLDGLWQTTKGNRSIEEAGYSIEILRKQDADSDSPGELAIPMPIPRHLDWKSWKNIGRYLIAPSAALTYDSFRGAQWKS